MKKKISDVELGMAKRQFQLSEEELEQFEQAEAQTRDVHELKRLHLLDDGRRKRSPEGMTYAIHPGEVRDMMHRYNVLPIENAKS